MSGIIRIAEWSWFNYPHKGQLAAPGSFEDGNALPVKHSKQLLDVYRYTRLTAWSPMVATIIDQIKLFGSYLIHAP